jgi:Coenzyme PQQ synthesis protein D (PqqD)
VTRPVNLLGLRPARGARWERRPDGLVTVLVPRFRNRLAVRWLMPLFARPDITVRLDEEGSFVWDRCDGDTTVLAIAEQLQQKIGGDADAVMDRVGRFVQKLVHTNLATIELPGDPR